MKSLFVDLFKYRTRENREQLENWLTECLCAVLRTLSNDDLCMFLDKLAEYDFGTFASALGERELRVESQKKVSSGEQPDIVIYAKDIPFVVFENKVRHSVGKAVDKDGSVGPNQLARYAKWLSEEANLIAQKPLLVFLTHSTPAPFDFDDPSADAKYGGVSRRSIRWSPLARILKSDFGTDPTSLTGGLIEAFVGILENHNMLKQYPSDESIQAATLYMREQKFLSNLVQDMANVISKSMGRRTISIEPEIDGFYGTISVSIQLKPTQKFPSKKIAAMVGIWFRDDDIPWGTDHTTFKLPSTPSIFLCLTDDTNGALIGLTLPSEHWQRADDEDLLNCKPLSDFNSDPDIRGQEILKWAEDEGVKLKSFMLNAGLIESAVVSASSS